MTAILVACLAAALPMQGWCATIDANPGNYRSLLASLNPGDTLVLASGTYTSGLPISDKHGSAAQPIVIRGPADRSAIFKANDCCNTVQLQDSSFVEIRNLTLDGAGTNGAFGVDSRGACHDITIENLRIVNYGADQQVVGISTKGPAWNWVIRHNTIIGAGTGLYLGNSDGSAPFVNGIIEYNVVADTLGYNMQIKHQSPRPTGIGLPSGPSRTIVRHNVWSKQNNAVGGANARPNVLVGHFPLSGAGASDRYEIYGNFFYQNPTEALFQGEGNIALYDNVFVNTSGSAINIRPHNDKPRTVTVFHNTVVATGNGIAVAGGDAAYVQKIVGNASFAAVPVAGPNQTGNITGSYAAAADHLVAPTAAIGSLDLFPKAGKLTGPAIDLSQFAGFADSDRDFNGSSRDGTRRGAYEGEGTNPGWRLAIATKPAAGATPAPTIALAADPLTVPLQGSSTLTWNASNASDCSASGGWSGPKALSGDEVVGPLAATTTFSMTCTGQGGSTTRSVTVTTASEASPPTVMLSASPGRIGPGESSQLTWSSSGATSCVASGGWNGSRPVSGSETAGPLESSTTYVLTCTGDGGSAAATAQVDVVAAPTPPEPPQSSEGRSGGGALSPGAVAALLLLLARRRLA
jgi:hypothetical protein